MKRIAMGLLGAGVVASVAAVVAFASGRRADPLSIDVIDRPIVAAVVRAGQIDPPEMTQRFRGDVRARRRSGLAFRRGGRVTEVLVREGDVVAAGEVLARIDVSDLDAEQSAAEAALQSARARLEEAAAGPRREAIEAARAEFQALEESARSAANQLLRQRRLLETGAGNPQRVEDLSFEFKRLRSAADAAESTLEELENGTRVERVAAARADVAAAEAKLAAIAVRRDDSRVVSPYDAVVSSRMIDEGVVVGDSTRVLEVYQRPPMEARFAVPPAVAERLAGGDLVRVDVGQGDGHSAGGLTAYVARSHPVVDPRSRTVAVDVQFDGAVDLVPGRSVTLLVREDVRRLDDVRREDVTFPAVWLPTTALVRGSRGVWSVYTVDDGTVTRRVVRTGRTDGTLVEVFGDLADAAIVATGTHRLAVGMAVGVVEFDGSSSLTGGSR